MSTVLAIVPVASDVPLRVPVAGRPALAWVLSALEPVDVARIIVAPQLPLDEEDVEALVRGICPGAGVARPSRGRLAAVRAALAMEPDLRRVLICDADQPLVTPECLRAVLAGIGERTGAVAASPVKATVKRVADGVIQGTVPRDRLCYLQGQRAFPRELLEQVLGEAGDRDDEVEAARAAGARLSVQVWDGPAPRVRGASGAVLAGMLLARGGRTDG